MIWVILHLKTEIKLFKEIKRNSYTQQSGANYGNAYMKTLSKKFKERTTKDLSLQ